MAWAWERALCYLFACCCVALCAAGVEGEPCEVTILGPNPHFVEFGSTVFLNCTMTYNTTCNTTEKLVWETSLRKQENKNTTWTTMSSTMDQWASEPKCLLVISEHNIPTSQISVVAYVPPKDVRINMDRDMEESHSYELTCEVKNIAPKKHLIVLIKRGNETLRRQSYADDRSNGSTSVTVTYVITPRREDHEAEFTCLAQLDLRPNGKLFERSSNTTVRVISLPEDPKIDVLSVIDKGSNVTTKCEVANAFPIDKAEIELKMDEKVLNITTELRNGDVISAEAVLPAAEPGKYLLMCNANIGDINKTAKKQLLIFDFPDPVLENLTNSEELSVGTEVNVTCSIEKTYPREVRVSLRIGTHLKTCELESPDFCTHVLRVQKQHNGVTVACEVTMSETNMTKSTTATMNVVYAPEFSNILCPSTQTVVEGRNSTFSCKADGSPAPSIRCSKDASVDTWQQIGRKDSGSFKCTAKNSVGDRVQVVKVTVEYKPNVTLVFRGPENIGKGQNLTLECLADGLPAPEYIWTTPKGADVIYSSDNRILTITSATSDHSGSYTCEARNQHGSDTQQKEIQVADTLPLILGVVLGSVGLVAAVAGGVAYYLWNRARKIRKYELQKSKQKTKKPANKDNLLPQENKVLPFEM
ncbi:hypothetical protein NDU88_004338 [Pleurodeles waltl]|uniref:Ig-like domain-containing protein n=1 Tax=Pleurodeles waltl TaxID=8319 RepID=A0AAV7T878_PLEWA|nr:hypothetical protein NDU88_004338 [Pleurodeles waltl]